MSDLNGNCLCGAVTITAEMADPKLRACHCDMCRQHTSSAFVSIEPRQESLVVNGPVKTYRSSDWAERGFCEVCGSTLWYSTVHDGARYLAAGLFQNAGGAELAVEFFSDACPQGYSFAGSHKKLSTKETIALFAPDEGETP